MDWLQLVKILAPLILECLANRGRERTRNSLRRMGPIETVRLRRRLRQAGVPNVDEEVRAVSERLRDATDEELDEILDEAEAVAGGESTA